MCMSGLEATINQLKTGLALSDRAKSLDSLVSNEKPCNNEVNRELHLSRKEYCSASFLGTTPEEFGDYVWSDGCKYEGEWRCGMRHGKGKLQWPSDGLYEGEFSWGYIHGFGTYTRSENMTYKGRWRLNRKHGFGYQRYPNGDAFEGSWNQGRPEGPGKYIWKNGNVYIGNMKGGKMSGKGTLTWVNGDSYQGNWLNGMMHGFGVYTWGADCGSYLGTWLKGLKDGKGTYYPRCSKVSSSQRQLYLYALRKQGLLLDLNRQNQDSRIQFKVVAIKKSMDKLSKRARSLNVEQQSRTSNVTLERRWSLEDSIQKILGYDRSPPSSSSNVSDSLFENEAQSDPVPILEREYVQGVLVSENVLSNSLSPSIRRQKKLPGEQIIEGHRSYDLMLSLQLGIRYSMGKITSIQRREVKATDFVPRACFRMTFPREGSQVTHPHQSEDFKWKDYCPIVFRLLVVILFLISSMLHKSSSLVPYTVPA